MNTSNPYQAPSAPVSDPVLQSDSGELLDTPRAVPAGHGWRWIAQAWELFKANPLVWMALVFLFFGVNLALNIVPLVGPLLGNMLFPFLVAAVGLLGEGIRRGGAADLGAALNGLQTLVGGLVVLGLLYLLAMIVVGMAMVVPLVAMGGLKAMAGHGGQPSGGFFAVIALVVFAVTVPVAMAFYFAPYLVAINGKSPIDAIKLSFAACVRNILPGILLMLGFIGLAIVATLPLFLGWFVLIPLMMIASYAAYRDLFYEG
jgi:hypothetical protein